MEPTGTDRRIGARPDDSEHDELTGLFNRRHLRNLFLWRWNDLTARHGRVALVVLDLDGFKSINDRLGHLIGDTVLTCAAERFRTSFRKEDEIFRYGGDEFVIVLPGAGSEDARVLADRARSALEEDEGLLLLREAGNAKISFSVGAAAYPGDGTEGEQLLAIADERLYSEKRRRQAMRRRPGRVAAVGLFLAAVVWGLVGRVDDPRIEPGSPAVERPADAMRLAPGPVLRTETGRVAELEKEVADLRRLLARKPASQVDSDRADGPRPSSRPVCPPSGGEPASLLPGAVGATGPSMPPTETPARGSDGKEAPDAPLPSSIPPRLLSFSAPSYPSLARAFHREATVELAVQVDSRGRVIGVEGPSKPIGLGFDEAARRVATSARYVPGTRNGQPATMPATLRVDFRIGGFGISNPRKHDPAPQKSLGALFENLTSGGGPIPPSSEASAEES